MTLNNGLRTYGVLSLRAILSSFNERKTCGLNGKGGTRRINLVFKVNPKTLVGDGVTEQKEEKRISLGF